MHHTAEASKFLELRAKTDRQLATLIARRVETGLEDARKMAEGGMAADDAYWRAVKGYEEALQWMQIVDPRHSSTPRLRARLALLRALLEEVPASHDLVQTACSLTS